jgi:O-acetyl-ADP-ribose deacetylase (regulator of RNase III)
VIHTVGPVWENGRKNEPALLASCYERSLDLAVKSNLKTIAFPNISTGVYGFPKEEAAQIAIETVSNWLRKNPQFAKVIFVVFDAENYSIYARKLTPIG